MFMMAQKLARAFHGARNVLFTIQRSWVQTPFQFPGVQSSKPFRPGSLFFSQFDSNYFVRQLLVENSIWLEWPILKCLHMGKECQVTYMQKLILNGKFGSALWNITSNVSVVKYRASWSFPDENLTSRKEIISNYQWGDYCMCLWWILFDLKRNA